MKRIISFFLCVLMTAALLAGCGDRKQRTTWIIAVDGDFSPFVCADANGKAVGLDVELLDAIARDQNFRYELRPSDWDTAMSVFTSHQAQVLMGSIASSQERIDGGWFFSHSFYDGVTQSMAMEPSSDTNTLEDLAGKAVVFHVKVNEVKVKELPAIDDEFAKDVSEFDTLKELKADIKKKMADERTAAAQRAFEDVLMTKVAEGIKADIPDEMIEMQAHQMLEGFKQQLASQGIPFDQYTKMTGMNEEQIIMDAKEPATNQVRMDLAIRAIIKAENLEVSDEEVENEMKSVAEKYGMDLDTVKKYLRAEDVKEQVMREKVIKVVADSATAVAPEVKEEETKTEEEEEKKD